MISYFKLWRLLEKRGYYWQTYCLQYGISGKEADERGAE